MNLYRSATEFSSTMVSLHHIAMSAGQASTKACLCLQPLSLINLTTGYNWAQGRQVAAGENHVYRPPLQGCITSSNAKRKPWQERQNSEKSPSGTAQGFHPKCEIIIIACKLWLVDSALYVISGNLLASGYSTLETRERNFRQPNQRAWNLFRSCKVSNYETWEGDKLDQFNCGFNH